MQAGIAVILTNTEQLSTQGFAKLTDDKALAKRLYALGVDEVHLLSSWGISLRPSLQQIGHLRARLPPAPVIALTGTLRAGVPTTSVCSFLGLHPGQFFFIRRSNLRHDVQLLFRPMISSVTGDTFPELDWVLREDRKVFCDCQASESTPLNSTRFLHHPYGISCRTSSVSDPSECEKRVRLYNSVNWAAYNDKT